MRAPLLPYPGSTTDLVVDLEDSVPAMCARAATLAVAFACFTTGLTGQAFAQTVIDPNIVEFDPSADHWATSSDGQPLVARYDLAIYQTGATQAYEVVSVGKPAPGPDGKIRLALALSLLSTWPLPLITYEARVAAVGPLGSTVSNSSNVFSFSGPCAYDANASNQSFGSAGGLGTVSVTAGTGCTWSAGAEASWVALAPSGGTGSGTVTVTVAPNDSALSRSTFLNVASQSLPLTQGGNPVTVTPAGPVTQAGSSCSYLLSSYSETFAAPTTSDSVSLTTQAGCAWAATSNVAWVTVTMPSGTGSKSVSFKVSQNPKKISRTGILTIAGLQFVITQNNR
jgi:hypothetical protein